MAPEQDNPPPSRPANVIRLTANPFKSKKELRNPLQRDTEALTPCQTIHSSRSPLLVLVLKAAL